MLTPRYIRPRWLSAETRGRTTPFALSRPDPPASQKWARCCGERRQVAGTRVWSPFRQTTQGCGAARRGILSSREQPGARLSSRTRACVDCHAQAEVSRYSASEGDPGKAGRIKLRTGSPQLHSEYGPRRQDGPAHQPALAFDDEQPAGVYREQTPGPCRAEATRVVVSPGRGKHP